MTSKALRHGILMVCFLEAAPGAFGASLYPEMKPPFVAWAENGKAMATIVAQPPKEGTFAATELNQWLRRIVGVELPVVEKAPTSGPCVFLGGETAWKRLGVTAESLNLGNEGYIIRTVGDDLVIAGTNNLATLFGVYAFLEHYLGCRWFWPGEVGLVVPQQTTLRVGRIDEASRPDFSIREIIRDRACAKFNRLNVNLREPGDFRIQWFVHTYLHLVEPSRYWKEHPEFYAELGGKRVDPTKPKAQVNLCTTNPEVVAAAVRKIDEVVTADPAVSMISVDPMDTQQFCQCENCRKLQDPEAPYEARASRLVFDFTNRVAEQVAQKHPNLLIKTIAYHTYLAPPPFQMADNVVIQFCRFMCHNHPLCDASCPESGYFNRQLLAWRKVCRRIMLYEYYAKGSWCGLPWPIVHMLRRDIPYLRENSVAGIASQWNRNDANNGLGYYVAAKLLWDSKIDVDALLSDFYEKAYAEAAAPMRRYHERLETAMEQSGLHVAEQRGYRTMHQFLSPPLLAALGEDIQAAQKVVRDPGATRRVELMSRGLQYANLVSDYLRVIASRAEKGTQPLWYSEPDPAMAELEAACAPRVEAIKRFLMAKENVGAAPGLGTYEELLLTPKYVASLWYTDGDRPEGGQPRLTKVQWLRQHPQELSPTPPKTISLWIYGNDIDWAPDTGPEHTVSVAGRDGAEVLLDKIGRPDRNGNRVNLAFIIRRMDPTRLELNPLRVTVENPPGGPVGSRIFALYLMPDDETSEDEATRLIQQDLESVRRRAAAFVEFGFNGEPSNEGKPLKADLQVPGYPMAKEPR
jgi:hypothetical protein